VTAIVFFLAQLLAASSAVRLEPGAEIHVRLMTPVSTAHAKPGDPVEAVVIAPLLERVTVRGRVREARAAGKETRARLGLEFQGAELLEVDNARESVDSEGRIVGILRSETLAAQIDRGLEELGKNKDFKDVAAALGALKALLVKDADPEIVYPKGTELRLRLTQPLDAVRHRRASGGVAPAHLQELARRQPARTVALKPRLPSDITNLLFMGSREELTAAFAAAGWTRAQEVNSASVLETARAIIEARGYHEAPVSTLLLDGREPDLVFQKTTNTFAKRHHVRLWRRPGEYRGRNIWVAAATHDVGLAFAPDERTFFHTIDADIDKERDKIVHDLVFAERALLLGRVVRDDVPVESRNATGDLMRTDRAIAILELTSSD